jgi:hypothetical protein
VQLGLAYCFFLSKEMLYLGSRFRMADELLETYLRQLIDAHEAADPSPAGTCRTAPKTAVAFLVGVPAFQVFGCGSVLPS